MSNPVIIPNCNPNLVVLHVWDAPEMADTYEVPIIAWRIVEDDEPIPISIEGEMRESSACCAAMVYDRASQIGIFQGGSIHTRTACAKELHDDIARCKRKQVKS